MRRLIGVGLLVCFITSSAYAEPTFIERLDGAASYCGFISSGGHTRSFLAQRDSGSTSKKYKDAVAQSFKESGACVAAEKPKMKSFLKDEVSRHPDSKTVIMEAYGAWIGYMDWLGTPRDTLEESPEKRGFESSINRLRAEMDAM